MNKLARALTLWHSGWAKGLAVDGDLAGGMAAAVGGHASRGVSSAVPRSRFGLGFKGRARWEPRTVRARSASEAVVAPGVDGTGVSPVRQSQGQVAPDWRPAGSRVHCGQLRGRQTRYGRIGSTHAGHPVDAAEARPDGRGDRTLAAYFWRHRRDRHINLETYIRNGKLDR